MKIIMRICSLVLAVSLMLGSLVSLGFADETGETEIRYGIVWGWKAQYLSEEYLLVDLREAFLPTETEAEIELNYESGRTEKVTKCEDIATLTENGYCIIPGATESGEGTKLLILPDTRLSTDRIAKIKVPDGSFMTEERVLLPENTVTVANSTESYTFRFSFKKSNGQEVERNRLYTGCYSTLLAFIPQGVDTLYSSEVVSPSGEVTEGVTGSQLTGVDCTFNEEGIYTFNLLCNGEICRQEEVTVNSKAKARSLALSDAFSGILLVGGGCIEGVALSPLLLLLFLNPVFIAFSGGIITVPAAVLKMLADAFSGFFNAIFNL